MDVNQPEMGAVHIRLPFKSMDDVSFSGSYAPVADQLVQTLKDHLTKQEPPDLGLDYKVEEEDNTPEPPEIKEGLATEQLPGGYTGLINSGQYAPPDPIEQLKQGAQLK